MEILFQDKDIVVCVKEPGMDSEKDMPKVLETTTGKPVFAVHRLDLNVGGVMVYAKNARTAAMLSGLIQNGQMVKEYLAIVHGMPDESGDLQDLLWKDSSKNKVFVVKRERKGVKKARLTYFVRKRIEENSLVEIRLYTGRSHQIRVQFSSRGFPLLGDHKYGARDNESLPKLFSFRLTFPYCGKEVSFSKEPEWV